MNLADWLFLGALLVSIVIGIVRGFTREFFGLVTWVIAIVAALWLAPVALGWLEPHISTPSLRIAASYAVVFFVVLALGAVVTAIISSLVRKSPLSGVDRTIGGGFGLIRGVLLLVVAIWILRLLPVQQDPWWKESKLVPPLVWLADGFRSILPEKWQQYATPAAEAAGAAQEGL